ncbi:RNA polymerase sigma factor [Alistipes ihumii]|uniref:RNA polymerase sigma factor n=1 Tax=Alistipes ihumii TaxID=1470347 RepID=UPI0039F51BBD
MTEEELIRRCSRNDRTAQQKLYEKYAPKMYGVCFRYVCHREIAQDLLHDGFITVFSKIGDFRGEGSLEGWIRRIFVNTALGYLRKKNVLQDSEQIDALRQVEGTEASAVERMETAELLRCIGKLPDGYRAVLNLFAVEGYSHREIAEMLGVSEGTSRSQYLRAKGCLLKILKEEEVI